jgi:hypothetical protein
MNIQPATAEAGFDMRLPPMNAAEMDVVERMIRDEWAPASLNFTVTFTIQAKRLQPDGSASVTSTDAAVNPWWGVFRDSMAAQGLRVAPEIFPAATDASYLRVLGIPSLGFSPMRCVHACTYARLCAMPSADCRALRLVCKAHAEAAARARRVPVGRCVRGGHRHLRAAHL